MANKLGIENFGRGRLLLLVGKVSLPAMGSTLRLETKLMTKEAAIEKRLSLESSVTAYLHIYNVLVAVVALSPVLTINVKHEKHKNISKPMTRV